VRTMTDTIRNVGSSATGTVNDVKDTAGGVTDTARGATDTATGSAPSPMDGLKDAVRGLGQSAIGYGLGRAGSVTEKLTGRLTDFAEGKGKNGDSGEGGATGPLGQAVAGGVGAAASGDSPVAGALKGAVCGVKDKIKEKLPGGGGRKSPAKKFSNIVDSFDVGVPLRVAYNQWTQFNQWSEFMKKLEFAEINDEEGKVQFRAKIFVLHRSWEQTIIDMVPDDHIVWQSTGQKGYLNGAVTFSELAHNLTRISLVVEYHPAGFWEHTLNLWRSVGSRVRLETKLYIHHVMTSTQLDPEAVQGWRAEIHDKEIVRTHDEVVEQERQEQEERERREQEERERQEQEDQAALGDETGGEESDADRYEDADQGEGEDEFDEDRPADDEDEQYDDAEEGEDGYDEEAATEDGESGDRESGDGQYDEEGDYDDDEDEDDYDDEEDGDYEDQDQGAERSDDREPEPSGGRR
jgi:uncharacterized membrane protein